MQRQQSIGIWRSSSLSLRFSFQVTRGLWKQQCGNTTTNAAQYSLDKYSHSFVIHLKFYFWIGKWPLMECFYINTQKPLHLVIIVRSRGRSGCSHQICTFCQLREGFYWRRMSRRVELLWPSAKEVRSGNSVLWSGFTAVVAGPSWMNVTERTVRIALWYGCGDIMLLAEFLSWQPHLPSNILPFKYNDSVNIATLSFEIQTVSARTKSTSNRPSCWFDVVTQYKWERSYDDSRSAWGLIAQHMSEFSSTVVLMYRLNQDRNAKHVPEYVWESKLDNNGNVVRAESSNVTVTRIKCNSRRSWETNQH